MARVASVGAGKLARLVVDLSGPPGEHGTPSTESKGREEDDDGWSEIERVLVDDAHRHGDDGEPVAAARALRTALCDLKRELVRHFLDCRIMEAVYPTQAMNN